MDIENLAKELILKNMTPEQQMAVLDSVRQSVANAKEVQKKKIGENVDLVVQALKKIESDIRDRFDAVGNSIEKRVLSIQDGRDGSNGKDGRDGRDGKSGKDGIKGDRGIDGQAGRDGVDGIDGISVVNAHIDFDGSLVIALSDGRELNVGEVVSQDIAEKIKVISTMSTNAAIAIKDEGTSITSAVKNINFVGATVTATNSGDDVTVNVSAGTGTVTSVAATAGTGISVSGSPITTTGTLTITNTAPDKTVALTQGGTTTITGTYPNFTISSADQFQGTVTSVAATVPAFLSITGSPVTTTGTLAIGLSGTALPVANGGTGQTTYTDGQLLIGNTTGNTLTKTTLTAGSGVSITNGNGSISIAATNTGTVTSVSALTLGTSGTDLSSTVATSTTTPVITLNVPTASATNRGALSSADWTTFNNKGSGTVTSVTGTSPIASSGGATPAISLSASYGDTQNPYASKTLKYVLAAPNSADGVPTFRALVASDIPTLNQSTTGSAATLTTPRAIYGNNFDGSAALTQIIASTYGGTGNGFTKFTGATTAERTYTLPDATTTILTTNTAVTVGQGGSGQTSYTDGQLLIGNTTGNTLTKATLTAGTGISITNGNGSISIASTATGTVTSVAATVPAFLSVAGSPITTSGTLAISLSGTALPIANGGTGITSFGTGVSAWLGTPSSANLASAITDETGSGSLVFGTSPTLTTPNINSAQFATVSGTAPLYACRAWVNFNGTGTVAIRGSGNVSSITDNGTGNYTINFTTAMTDVNYSVSGYCVNPASRALIFGDVNTYATGSLRINSAYVSGTNGEATSVDATYVNVNIFR